MTTDTPKKWTPETSRVIHAYDGFANIPVSNGDMMLALSGFKTRHIASLPLDKPLEPGSLAFLTTTESLPSKPGEVKLTTHHIPIVITKLLPPADTDIMTDADVRAAGKKKPDDIPNGAECHLEFYIANAKDLNRLSPFPKWDGQLAEQAYTMLRNAHEREVPTIMEALEIAQHYGEEEPTLTQQMTQIMNDMLTGLERGFHRTAATAISH